MARRLWFRRPAGLAVAAFVAGGLGGCTGSNKVTLTNVSDSWLNVRFFVSTAEGSNELTSKRRFQVKPGETARFAISRGSGGGGTGRLVHMEVETVTPSWEPADRQYWMELLTEGPIKIVASGKGDKLEFETGAGQVAQVPGRQRKRRFEYTIAGAPVE
jgi:hypothetical protein